MLHPLGTSHCPFQAGPETNVALASSWGKGVAEGNAGMWAMAASSHRAATSTAMQDLSHECP